MDVFELFLRDGHIVVWPGQNGTDAAHRYTACVERASVIAYRHRKTGAHQRRWRIEQAADWDTCRLEFLRAVADFDQHSARFQDRVAQYERGRRQRRSYIEGFGHDR